MSKRDIIQLLEKMPDDSSDFDILRKIEETILIKNDLKASRQDIESGNYSDHNQVFEKYKKWLIEK